MTTVLLPIFALTERDERALEAVRAVPAEFWDDLVYELVCAHHSGRAGAVRLVWNHDSRGQFRTSKAESFRERQGGR